MPTFRITITAPLPEDSLAAFRARHDVEAGVADMLSYLDALDVSIACVVEVDGALMQIKRKRGDPHTSEQLAAREPLIEAGNKILTMLTGSSDHETMRAIWRAALVAPTE